MTPDLDALDELATAAEQQIDSGNEWDRQHGDALGDFETALDPATVRSLIALARLGAAWEEAEAALPEGWNVKALIGDGMTWDARAGAYGDGWMGASRRLVVGMADTPAAALTALAAALRTPEPVKP